MFVAIAKQKLCGRPWPSPWLFEKYCGARAGKPVTRGCDSQQQLLRNFHHDRRCGWEFRSWHSCNLVRPQRLSNATTMVENSVSPTGRSWLKQIHLQLGLLWHTGLAINMVQPRASLHARWPELLERRSSCQHLRVCLHQTVAAEHLRPAKKRRKASISSPQPYGY